MFKIWSWTFSGLFVFLAFSIQTQAQSNWADKMKFSNDFRLRNEYIETTNSSDHTLLRQRLRARLGLEFALEENLISRLKLASGSTDPVSTNQTMEGGFSSKSIQIDEAHVEWKPLEDLQVYLGKAKPIFYAIGKNEIIWDHDLRPEGMAASYELQKDSFGLETNTALYWVDSDKNDQLQILLSGLQIAGHMQLKDDLKMELVGGIYDYSHIQNHAVVYCSSGSTDCSSGNSVSGTGSSAVYSEKYQLVEVGLGFSYSGLGLPMSVYYNAVNNAQSDVEENGYILGLNVGKVKEKGDWSFHYSYRRVEANAVLGAFSDSDFNDGNTNGKGSEVALGYGLSKSASTQLTFFANETSLGSTSNDYHRGQLDFMFSF